MVKNGATIFVSRNLPKIIETRMQDLFNVHFNPLNRSLSSEELISYCQNHDVLVSTITDLLDKKTIEHLPNSIKLIAQFGNGVDNIDIEAASKRSIIVTNTPSAMSDDTADMAMALILSIPRRLVEGSQILIQQEWEGWSPNWMLGSRLKGKILGIIGLGRIGLAVADRAKSFGLDIYYYSRNRRPSQIEEKLDATWCESIDELIERVDIVSLHVPLTSESEKIMNRERLKKMKPDAILINVSRPELVDEAALIELLENGHLSGAGLDVFEHQNGINPRLVNLAKNNRVLLTPHMASATIEGRIEMGETVMINIKTFLDGHRPPNRILLEVG